MKIPLELEHLIKTTSSLATPCLSKHLACIEERKALEVEHYLRACALRLDLHDGRPRHIKLVTGGGVGHDRPRADGDGGI